MSVVDQNAFRRILFRSVMLPVSIGLITSIAFVIVVNLLYDESHRIRRTNKLISQAHETQKLLIDAETGLRGYVITGQNSFLEPYKNAVEKIPQELAALRNAVSTNTDQSYRVSEISRQYENWLKYAEEIIVHKSDKEADRLIATGKGKVLMDSIRTFFVRIISYEETLSENQTKSLNNLTQIVLIIIISLSVLVSLIGALFARKQILNLSDSYEVILKASNERNNQLMHQQWLKTGQSELGDLMAQDHSLNSLAEVILTYVAKYLNAQVGSFYIASGKLLERKATYAFESDSRQGRVLEFGQGQVGQAALDKKPILLSDIKSDYIKVSSSLGDVNPAQLLIAPFAVENRTLGVLELGFVGAGNDKALDFYEQISEGISTAIEAAHFRDQREQLLKEIQNQAEELQTQQEELRVNNEELEEQTRMLKETHARLESQHAEMEQTNAQLEEQTQILENQKDLLDKRNQTLLETKRSLEQKTAEVLRASQYKSEFLANMSHELRTPLNSSLIFAKILVENKEGNLTSQQVEFCKQIQSSGNDLLTLINDILDLSKVESGKLNIVEEKIDVPDLIERIQASFKTMADTKGLSFTVSIAANTPQEFISDHVRVEQILKNLLSNAIKFTEKGTVSLKVFFNSERNVCFEVKDTGIGIGQEQQEYIFDAFRQADGTTSRKYGGTGLGLSISKNLAQILGGKIHLHSEVGHGSTFTVELPLEIPKPSELNSENPAFTAAAVTPISIRQPEATPAPEPRAFYFKDDRETIKPKDAVILIVEDDPKFAQILFELGHEHKYQCLVTNSGEEALELADKFTLQAVMLDITLTDHNGLYVLDQLKQKTRTRHVPVHIISASDFSRQALHLGAVGYQLKPVKREEISQAIMKFESKFKHHKRRVLIVEDNDVQRGAIEKLIQDKNLETVAVGTGEKALKVLSDEDFDCVIVDVNLPDMSGFDLLEKLNIQKLNNYPPVIVYTGRDLSREEELRLSRYSRSVIIKGAKSPERLLDEVTLFLHKVESTLDSDKQDMLLNLRNRDKVFENKTIMVVDDDMRNTFALTAALERKGAKVVIAKNGEESIQKLKAKPEEIDMILMDIMMPVMDGYQATREIRKIHEFKRLPIIALTAKATKDDRQMCMNAGANDYLAKPVDLDKLISLARVWLNAGWR